MPRSRAAQDESKNTNLVLVNQRLCEEVKKLRNEVTENRKLKAQHTIIAFGCGLAAMGVLLFSVGIALSFLFFHFLPPLTAAPLALCVIMSLKGASNILDKFCDFFEEVDVEVATLVEMLKSTEGMVLRKRVEIGVMMTGWFGWAVFGFAVHIFVAEQDMLRKTAVVLAFTFAAVVLVMHRIIVSFMSRKPTYEDGTPVHEAKAGVPLMKKSKGEDINDID